jgi:ferric-dicitrate binding protein FerR (iron transport regulator)
MVWTRRRPRGWVGILGLLACCAAACDNGAAAESQPATVLETRGATFLCRDTFPADLTTCPAATVGATVVVNGGVHTGPGDATLLMKTRGTTFRLLPNSSLRYVESTSAGALFLLTAGRVFAEHEPGSDNVVIRGGDAGVAPLGTLFTAGIDATGVIVSVREGRVGVSVPPTAPAQPMDAGQGMHVDTGARRAPAPRPMTAPEAALWRQIGPHLEWPAP